MNYFAAAKSCAVLTEVLIFRAALLGTNIANGPYSALLIAGLHIVYWAWLLWMVFCSPVLKDPAAFIIGIVMINGFMTKQLSAWSMLDPLICLAVIIFYIK